jgi:hypothetical protein
MVKSHNIKLKITNHSSFQMTYKSDWYDSGRLADDYSWPSVINNDDHATVLNYERDWATTGCSGYVQYDMGGTTVTFSFSNPLVGSNKLGVGTGSGGNVWDAMDGHNYDPFVVKLTINNVALNFNCQCSGSTTNTADVSIFAE